MLKSKMSTAESFIALGGIIVGFTTCFIAGAPSGRFYFAFLEILINLSGGVIVTRDLGKLHVATRNFDGGYIIARIMYASLWEGSFKIIVLYCFI